MNLFGLKIRTYVALAPLGKESAGFIARNIRLQIKRDCVIMVLNPFTPELKKCFLSTFQKAIA